MRAAVGLVLGLTLGHSVGAVEGKNLVAVNALVSGSCELNLTGGNVLLPPQFQPFKTPEGGGGRYYLFSVRDLTDGIERSINPLVVIDKKSGKEITNLQTLALKIQDDLVSRHDTGIKYLEADNIGVSVNHPVLVIPLNATNGRIYLYKVDMLTQKVSYLTEAPAQSHEFDRVVIDENHGRYASIYLRSAQADFAGILIMDLKTNKAFPLEGDMNRASVTDDGQLMAIQDYRGRTGHAEVNVFDLKTGQFTKPAATFKGHLRAHSLNFTKMLFDENINSSTTYKEFHSPNYLRMPEPKLVRAVDNGWNSEKLDQWERIEQDILAKASEGTFLLVDSHSAQITPDGNHAVMRLTFTTTVHWELAPHQFQVASSHEDWFGLWDIRENRFLGEWTSKELDGKGDREPYPDKQPRGRGSVWQRALTYKLLDDGRVVVARNLQHFKSETRAYITTKVMVISPDGSVQKFTEQTPTFRAPENQWNGTTKIQIIEDSETGALQVMSEVVDMGIRIFAL